MSIIINKLPIFNVEILNDTSLKRYSHRNKRLSRRYRLSAFMLNIFPNLKKKNVVFLIKEESKNNIYYMSKVQTQENKMKMHMWLNSLLILTFLVILKLNWFFRFFTCKKYPYCLRVTFKSCYFKYFCC